MLGTDRSVRSAWKSSVQASCRQTSSVARISCRDFIFYSQLNQRSPGALHVADPSGVLPVMRSLLLITCLHYVIPHA